MKLCLCCGNKYQSLEWRCAACGYEPTTRDGFPCFAPSLVETGAGFDPARFDYLANVEADSFWFQARNRLIVRILRAAFPEARSLLEIGCGTGFVLAGIATALPELALTGSEIHTAGLVYAARRVPQATLYQMDAREIPFVEEFDVIGAFDVIEHIAEDELVLQRMGQACLPGGGIVVTVPQHPWLWSARDEAAHHKRRYTRSELIAKVLRAGFEVRLVTSFVSLLLPLMAIARLGPRAEPTTPSRELKLYPSLNGALRAVMAIERLLIAAGMRFPAGGSLLVVARKVSASPA
jgi:SAM-dependent methyltransferase